MEIPTHAQIAAQNKAAALAEEEFRVGLSSLGIPNDIDPAFWKGINLKNATKYLIRKKKEDPPNPDYFCKSTFSAKKFMVSNPNPETLDPQTLDPQTLLLKLIRSFTPTLLVS